MRGFLSTYELLPIRTTSFNSCKYQENMSFDSNLKEAYSSFLVTFFDCIRTVEMGARKQGYLIHFLLLKMLTWFSLTFYLKGTAEIA